MPRDTLLLATRARVTMTHGQLRVDEAMRPGRHAMTILTKDIKQEQCKIDFRRQRCQDVPKTCL